MVDLARPVVSITSFNRMIRMSVLLCMAQRMCRGFKKEPTQSQHRRQAPPYPRQPSITGKQSWPSQEAADASEAKPTAIGQSNTGAAHTDLPPVNSESPCQAPHRASRHVKPPGRPSLTSKNKLPEHHVIASSSQLKITQQLNACRTKRSAHLFATSIYMPKATLKPRKSWYRQEFIHL